MCESLLPLAKFWINFEWKKKEKLRIEVTLTTRRDVHDCPGLQKRLKCKCTSHPSSHLCSSAWTFKEKKSKTECLSLSPFEKLCINQIIINVSTQVTFTTRRDVHDWKGLQKYIVYELLLPQAKFCNDLECKRNWNGNWNFCQRSMMNVDISCSMSLGPERIHKVLILQRL